eukprot:COSAG04_NODE_272_length_18495_cov_17.526256_11_plen_108_part_00
MSDGRRGLPHLRHRLLRDEHLGRQPHLPDRWKHHRAEQRNTRLGARAAAAKAEAGGAEGAARGEDGREDGGMTRIGSGVPRGKEDVPVEKIKTALLFTPGLGGHWIG